MKIKLIVYSKTNNTFSVALALQNQLLALNHTAVIDRITVANENEPDPSKMKLTNIPTIDDSDVFIFGSPVQAFSLAQPMRLYLKTIEALNQANVLLFVTKGLSTKRLGGYRSIKKMTKACQEKNGLVKDNFIVCWGKKDRDDQIETLITQFIQTINTLQ